MSFCVYKHTCPNGKVYIGITGQKPHRRWNNGNGYACNEHFHRAILKYGWDNIKHEILLDGLTQEQAEHEERRFISLHRSNEKEFGYNIMYEACNVYHHSPESIAKMSDAKKGKRASEETRQKMSRSQTGRVVSAEVREKISAAQRGKSRSAHTEEWKMLMRERCSGEKSPCYGKRMSEEQKQKISAHTKNKRPVVQMSLSGEVLKEYPSAKQAERETGVFNGNIIACCKKKKPTMGGYKWVYAEELKQGGALNEPV